MYFNQITKDNYFSPRKIKNEIKMNIFLKILPNKTLLKFKK